MGRSAGRAQARILAHEEPGGGATVSFTMSAFTFGGRCIKVMGRPDYRPGRLRELALNRNRRGAGRDMLYSGP
jgi:hypothetical protein